MVQCLSKNIAARVVFGMGVIDSISQGFALVRRRPAIMLIPVLLDLLLLLAPQLSVEPVARALASALQMPPGMAGTSAYDPAQAREALLQFGKDGNLLALLASASFGVPSLVAGMAPSDVAHVGGVLPIAAPGLLFLLALMLAMIGLLIGSLYLTLLAAAVRGESPGLSVLLRRTARNWLHLLVLAALLLALGIGVLLPLSLIVQLVGIISPLAGGFIGLVAGLLILWAVLWVVFYLYFVVDAMVLQEVGVARAAVNSIVVVRSAFWPSIGLIVLLYLLTMGLSIVWHWLAGMTVLGLCAGIAGNAFVGSGLVAASLVFYRQRYEAWKARVMHA